jgi:hypothetical protein
MSDNKETKLKQPGEVANFESSPSPPSPMEEKAGMRRRLFSS